MGFKYLNLIDLTWLISIQLFPAPRLLMPYNSGVKRIFNVVGGDAGEEDPTLEVF